jgi:hypothetical protein
LEAELGRRGREKVVQVGKGGDWGGRRRGEKDGRRGGRGASKESFKRPACGFLAYRPLLPTLPSESPS